MNPGITGIFGTNSIVIPLEQGLRLLNSNSILQRQNSIVIPLEQGLRLFGPTDAYLSF